MLIDGLFDRLVNRIRHPRHRELPEKCHQDSQAYTRPQRQNDGQHGHGSFSGASGFVMNNPTFIENQTQISHMFSAGKPVLELILPHTDPHAAVDSSARFPPPLCHPGTRLKITARLENWLIDPGRQWNMIWLRGPAATGKSAVAQTFAERCIENGRLGASFFFSRPNKRDDPDKVIPSLVYQLAVRVPSYKSAVAAQLANDPQLMWKARHVQFKKLIVEPFLSLQTQGQTRVDEPLLVVLDGLDECKGESAQREIIEMISEAMRLKKDLPLLWLICSRPEAHIKYIFSRADYTVNCGREELIIDAESIIDVDLYIRDGLAGIRSHFEDATTPTWPPQISIAVLSNKASGHFGFASTALRYIGDLRAASPMSRFDHLLSFLAGVKKGMSNNPMEALDALYFRILSEIPDEVLPTVKRILYSLVYPLSSRYYPAQLFCNLLCIDQATFYSAVRKLHSVLDVPSPEAAFRTGIQFYHASFQDYLEDPRRSGAIMNFNDARLDSVKTYLSWHQTDLELSHAADGSVFGGDHKRRVLPGLKWASKGNEVEISTEIANEVTVCWWLVIKTEEWDEGLFSQIQNFDFRYIGDRGNTWYWLANKLWKVDPSNKIIRTEPRSEVDLQLLEYMGIMTGSREPARPAKFLLQHDHNGQYFLLGCGAKAVVCWTTGLREHPFAVLNSVEAPSKERIATYRALFQRRAGIHDEDRTNNDVE